MNSVAMETGSETYTLLLTQKACTISRAAADTIMDAVQRGLPTVEVEFDPWGPPTSRRRTTLVVAHVVAVSESAAQADQLRRMANDTTGLASNGGPLNGDVLRARVHGSGERLREVGVAGVLKNRKIAAVPDIDKSPD